MRLGNIFDVQRRWRWALVLVIAVAVLGSFMPSLFASVSSVPREAISLIANQHPLGTVGCAPSTCNPVPQAPSIPPLTIALVWTVLAGAIGYSVFSFLVSRRSLEFALARGVARAHYRPPRSS
jgi:hypothetical protein